MNDFTPQEIEIINECWECDKCQILVDHVLFCRDNRWIVSDNESIERKIMIRVESNKKHV